MQQILVKSQPTRCPISAQGASLSPLLIHLSSVQILQPYTCIYIRDSGLPQAISYRVFYPSCSFGVQLSAYPAARKASGPKDGNKEASSYITLNYSISIHLDHSTLPFCSSVYGTRHLKVMPLSVYYICRVSSIYLKAHSLSLQKKITSQ